MNRATQTGICLRNTTLKAHCNDKEYLWEEMNLTCKNEQLAHKELLIGFMLIAFKPQLTVSAVIRVPLQDMSKYTLFKCIYPI